ncbi:MAG: hypothetical protein MI743_19665, partial [Sneathiellales bacterium]|nr:hypothetical protein [Sneathiellales bacterium]
MISTKQCLSSVLRGAASIAVAAGVMIGTLATAQAVSVWDEDIDGDLRNSFGAPSLIGTLGVGEYEIYGSMADRDADIFNWNLSGAKLDAVTLIKWDTTHPGSSFYFDGANSHTPPAKDT